MNTKNICPASFIMIFMILLSCFAFMFSTSRNQQIAASFICLTSFLVFLAIQWVNSASDKA
jgi:hypothetical protein